MLTCLWTILTYLGCPLTCLERQLIITIQTFECVLWLCRPNICRNIHQNRVVIIVCLIVMNIWLIPVFGSHFAKRRPTPTMFKLRFLNYLIQYMHDFSIKQKLNNSRLFTLDMFQIISAGHVCKRIHMNNVWVTYYVIKKRWV
jgi:hypothetical protein